jgi:hemolysin D
MNEAPDPSNRRSSAWMSRLVAGWNGAKAGAKNLVVSAKESPFAINLAKHLDVAKGALALERERDQTAKELAETAFLPAALEVLETPPNPIGRTILWLMMGFLVIALAWACLGHVDEVAIASGKIIPRGEVKLIQAADYGVVRAIHVVDGQAVKKGQPLIELDPTVSAAEAEQARKSLLVAQTDQARARALAEYDSPTGGSALAPLEGVDPQAAETQQKLVAEKIREHNAAHAALVQQIAQHRGELAMVEAEVEKLRGQLPLAQSQYDVMKSLADQGNAPRMRVMELLERVIGLKQDLAIRKAEATKVRAVIHGDEQQLAKLDSEFKRESLDALNEAQAAVALRGEELKKAQEKSRLTVLKAPVDGVVQQLAVHTVGAVVKPADALLVVVPRGAELIVEAMVLNRDAGFVHEGDPVQVKFEAFPFTRYGVVPAVLETISRDAIENKEKGLVYTARARLLQDYIMIGSRRAQLAPGLAATAEIKTNERRIIEYLLSPLSRRIQEAGRER